MFRFRNRSGSRRVPAPAAVGTRVGTDDGFRAVVDTRSVVQPLGSGHRVEWWVGGEDRWYDPSTEAAVRQVRPGAAPVLETRLRVSGGDVVATTWAAVGRGSTGPAVVVELANETPVPVAVAVAVQAASGGQVRRISADGRRLLVDGTTAVVVDREPGRYALVDAAQDLWAMVSGGGAQVEPPRSVRCRIGAAAGALVVPLPHRASLRFAIPAADLVENPAASFPDADRVAAGWTARLVDAATVDIPDGVLSAGAHRALVDLQLAEPTAVGAVELARWGLGRQAVETLAATSDPAAERLVAAAHLWRLHRNPAWFEGPSGLPLEDLVRAPADRVEATGALGVLADLLDARGEARSAADAREAAAGVALASLPPTDPPTTTLRHLSDCLARESIDGLDLLTEVPAAWLGGGIEVHGLATPHGRLGYAVRWHGDRPALLWELDRWDDRPVVLRVPGLDTAFSTDEPTGEALLAAPAGRVPPRSVAASPPDGGEFF